MTPPPEPIRIFHITHVDNLASIVADGYIWSDAEMTARVAPHAGIGMSSIKQRRLALPVTCHPDTRVGEYVPFYFCPRSVMLYVLHMGNHPELDYRGGQAPIVHLTATLDAAWSWAAQEGLRTAFTPSNAGARYTPFYDCAADLERLDWPAIAATDFRDPVVKEAKQAEFLVQARFAWDLVDGVGVLDESIRAHVIEALAGARHRPPVRALPRWYF
jgi:hypothetical protein